MKRYICQNCSCGNAVPMRSRPTTPLVMISSCSYMLILCIVERVQYCNNFDVNVLDLRNISHEEAVLSSTSDQYVCI